MTTFYRQLRFAVAQITPELQRGCVLLGPGVEQPQRCPVAMVKLRQQSE
jgi:hypothetical protein